MSKAILGIGTNMGDRLLNLQDATVALNKIPMLKVIRSSSVYETKPWGFTEQQNFYNAVLEVETDLDENALLGVCLGIEAGMGRVRRFKNGPRVIDIDLLLFENVISNTKQLKLPHPYITERDFVLVPLKELFPELCVYAYNYNKDYEKHYKPNYINIVSNPLI